MSYTNHPGKLTLLINEDRVDLELTDAMSGVHVCEVTIPGPEFMMALGRRAYVDCSIALYHGPIGYRSEVKTEHIVFPVGRSLHPTTEKGKAQTESIERLALAPYEVDGWTTIRQAGADYRNHHNRVNKPDPHPGPGFEVFRVGFHRYVHPKTGQVWVPDRGPIAYTGADLDQLQSDVTTADAALSSTSEATYAERDRVTARLTALITELRAGSRS